MDEAANREKETSHSCESRNLRRRKAAGNCTPLQFPPSARKFLPSQEWDGRGGENRANGGSALRRMRFRLSPEWCIFN
ncbi:MAG: hypothetical protein ACR2QC_09230 [Gammaproteobacteria bacterium]